MNIVLLESLGISDSLLEQYAAKLGAAGHTFTAYPRTGDTARLIEEARDADVGVAFAGDKGLLFQRGKLLGNRPREEAIGELIRLAKAMLAAQ